MSFFNTTIGTISLEQIKDNPLPEVVDSLAWENKIAGLLTRSGCKDVIQKIFAIEDVYYEWIRIPEKKDKDEVEPEYRVKVYDLICKYVNESR